MAQANVTSLPTHPRTIFAPRVMVPLSYQVAKRGLDILGASLALLVLGLPMLLIALAIRLESRGPALFFQWRLGENGIPFRFCKFRSMVVNAEDERANLVHQNEAAGPIFKIRQDPRITRIGRWLRHTSFDETPQLLHVLSGKMSLVGPRPPLLEEVESYEPWQRERLAVRPGLTCIWQVSGRSDIPFDRWVELDIVYVRTRNFWLDIKILLLTIPAVITGRGAY